LSLTSATGTSIGSIRNRISALRVKQRDLYLELAWDLPEGGAGHSAKKTAGTPRKTPTTKKRAADMLDADDAVDAEGEEMGTPSKKPRAKKAKGKKGDEVIKEESVEGKVDLGDGIKEEDIDEELGEMV
jgi:hypothetical protein